VTSVTLGDMARAYLLRRDTIGLKTQLQTLTQEMTSGRKADLARAVSGDFKALAGIEHGLRLLTSYKTATAEAELFTDTLQTALETTATIASDLAPSLAAAGNGSSALVHAAAVDARQKLHSVVSTLNARVGDRYVLSGAATDRKPLAGAEAILGALTAAIAGQTTASGVITAVTTWFNAPAGGGGFSDAVYGGSAAPLVGFRVGAGDEAAVTLTATDRTLRDTLKGLALGALVAEGALAGDDTGRAFMMKTAGDTLMTATTPLADLRADLGSVQAHIADIATRNAAEGSALEIARNGIVAADPYETATALEAASSQIETFYTLTARLSRLSLADYLG
jgi:flagellar hook-associated protein 3 FlgL